jgi:hypothetical protein
MERIGGEMATVHDKYVVELAEVIKGYGNPPDVNDPFCLSEFYRFYEIPNVCVSAENFKKMRPLSDFTEENEARVEKKQKMYLYCLRCHKDMEFTEDAMDEMGYTKYSYCEDCLHKAIKMLKQYDNKIATEEIGKRCEE